MPHRAHLFSLRIANALRESLREGYDSARFAKDLLAGVTVGVIAIPLSMALAIASGVPPQNGLYTAVIAGFVIALTGGSRFSISGPTAAFIVILHPIVMKFGMAGLMIASLMAGLILVGMALLRLGRYIEYIPEAVTLGFTGGIAVVIATLQLKDIFGLPIAEMPESYVGKVSAIVHAFPQFSTPTVTVAGVTLALLLLWPRLKTPIPPHLPAVIIGSVLALWLQRQGYALDTIGSRFTFTLPDGSVGHGIPPILPAFVWPWLQPAAAGQTFELSRTTIEHLMPSAFAIAMLGAIESLLCAVVLDGMTGKRHSANSELMGQGIGNLITPFFSGITATAALARSAANYRAGAQTPLAAMWHALVVLAGLVVLAPLLAYLPMAAMSALLLVVAWNMSEAPKSVHLLKTAPRSDVLVFVVCLSLTVLFDMVIAISVGILLASLLFMREIAEMTQAKDISGDHHRVPVGRLPPGWQVIRINGPLFFAAADRVFGELSQRIEPLAGMVLWMDAVPLLDAGGLSALEKLLAKCRQQGKQLLLAEVQYQPLKTLRHAEVEPEPGVFRLAHSLEDALALLNAGLPTDPAKAA